VTGRDVRAVRFSARLAETTVDARTG